MVEEYESIVKNNVLEVVPRLADKSVVGSRRIFKVKQEADGSIKKYKAKFMAKGDEQLIISCKEDLAREFKIMKNMGLMHYFLVLELWQGDGDLFVFQGKYANDILQRFHMDKCKPIETSLATKCRKEDATSGEEVDAIVDQQLVGSLMYPYNTRPNMCYAINQLSQVMVRKTKLFWRETKHVLWYLRGTN
eukprot:PITA_03423